MFDSSRFAVCASRLHYCRIGFVSLLVQILCIWSESLLIWGVWSHWKSHACRSRRWSCVDLRKVHTTILSQLLSWACEIKFNNYRCLTFKLNLPRVNLSRDDTLQESQIESVLRQSNENVNRTIWLDSQCSETAVWLSHEQLCATTCQLSEQNNRLCPLASTVTANVQLGLLDKNEGIY